MAKKTKKEKRIRRKAHIRKKIHGTSIKPRVFVFKSNRYFYAGIADDDKSVVVKSLMTKKFVTFCKKYDALVFDRSGYKYHGLIKSFVEELRKEGVKI